MKITFANEVENIRDGSYIAILRDAFEFAPENLCMKFAICGDPESTVFVKFISAKELGGHRWRSVFKALDTNDSDVLIGHTFEFSVKNEKVKRRGGGEHITFCNIKSVSLVK
ncbi:hypothetical protein [uncultured Ruminococcus sp.]|uniref:hypothetical protein n=1 Tax=uncultured Ruminococcus sp. TaxID=165186 RepID=UPI00266C05B7|nr:hypothetical protein [uncultured Ruminococcus sp.]